MAQQQQQQQQQFLSSRLGGGANSAAHHHRDDHHHQKSGLSAASGQGRAHYKGHQRRQSVARLLPDISKLRLLSWLVEASNELINCDIAIMDGVYAKLNRSRESLLFWQQQQQQQGQAAVAAAAAAASAGAALNGSPAGPGAAPKANRTPPARPPPPAPPTVGPVSGGKLLLLRQQQLEKLKATASRQSSDSKQQERRHRKKSTSSSRNHHSLPLTNYDASSLAAVSLCSNAATIPSSSRGQHQSQLTPPVAVARRCTKGQSDAAASTTSRGSNCSSLPVDLFRGSGHLAGGAAKRLLAVPAGRKASDICDGHHQSDEEHSDSTDSDADSNTSAASSSEASTSSSGIHGAASLSSSASSTSASCSSSASSFGDTDAISTAASGAAGNQQQQPQQQSPAEHLSERIKRSVAEHNYLQTLLVNVIRQHDRLVGKSQQGPVRRHSSSLHQFAPSSLSRATTTTAPRPRIDLTELADSLDDGCLCSCHDRMHLRNQLNRQHLADTRSSTLPANQSFTPSAMSSTLSLFQPKSHSARKLRRKPKGGTAAAMEELSREDIIQKFSDKLCENCFETHYWLHSCSQFAPLEFASTLGDSNGISATATPEFPSSAAAAAIKLQLQQERAENLNSIISLRNATFIKLVQQQVRSTISKSIELIDLIRKEIKSPESIKQKQLMRCFSASVQLLTSVANYVVPTQDISIFIPNELTSSIISSSGQQQQTVLFNLPPGDFDHLLLYPTSSNLSDNNPNCRSSPYLSSSSSNGNHCNGFNLLPPNYHLAPAPEIPIRRRNLMLQLLEETPSQAEISDGSSPELRSSGGNKLKSSGGQPRTSTASDNQSAAAKPMSGTNTNCETTTTTNPPDSSSGASSNNSSASSSIARGTVQQSSLTRAHTPSAILKDHGNKQQKSPTSHDLASMLPSYETTSSLNRHHQHPSANSHHHQQEDDFLAFQSSKQPKFWQSSKFNFIKKLLQVKQQRLLRQQSKDRRIYNNKVQNKFRLVMMDLTHFNKSQQLLTTENGVNSLLTSMRNVLEFGLYLTVKLY